MTDPARIEFDAPIIRESVAEMVVRRILDMVKAGVLKAGAPAVIGRQREEAFKAIERRAADVHTRLTVLGVDFDAWAERGGMAFQTADLFMDLPAPALAGAHQIDNAAVAIAAALAVAISPR